MFVFFLHFLYFKAMLWATHSNLVYFGCRWHEALAFKFWVDWLFGVGGMRFSLDILGSLTDCTVQVDSCVRQRLVAIAVATSSPSRSGVKGRRGPPSARISINCALMTSDFAPPANQTDPQPVKTPLNVPKTSLKHLGNIHKTPL